MIPLIRSEALRARSRRIVWVLLATAILGMLVGVVIAAVNADRPSEEEIARGEQRYERQLAECMAGGYFGPDEVPPGRSLEEVCEENVRPEFFVPTSNAHLADLPEIIEGASVMLSLVGIVLGASLAGADWSTASMTTVLTWEPRRLRVWLVRAGIAVVVVAVAIVVLLVVFTVMWTAASKLRGTSGIDGGFVGDVLDISWRVTVIAAVFGLVAHAVASVGRSTIAGVGIIFGYAVIFEGFVAGLAPSVLPRLLVRAATVVVSDRPLIDPRGSATFDAEGPLIDSSRGVLLDVTGAWIVLAVWIAVLSGLAIAAFRARDVQ